jgi:hypothetical protein
MTVGGIIADPPNDWGITISQSHNPVNAPGHHDTRSSAANRPDRETGMRGHANYEGVDIPPEVDYIY